LEKHLTQKEKIKSSWVILFTKGIALLAYLIYTQETVFRADVPAITGMWLFGILMFAMSMGIDIQKTKQYPPDADWFDRMSDEEKDRWLESQEELNI